MQVYKNFSGTCTVGDVVTRTASWGGTATLKTYETRLDYYNNLIAEFLANDCGITGVVYEARGDYSEKYVWIYDVPFLFGPSSSSYNHSFYGPFATTYIVSAGTSSAIYNPFSTTTGTYNFYLCFTGTEEAGFCLRVSPYGTTTPTISTTFRFVRCTNLCNGRDALVYSGGSQMGVTSGYGLLNGYCVLEIENSLPVNDASVTMDPGSYFPISISADTYQLDYLNDKLPLIPIHYGIYQAKKCYLHVRGIGLPEAAALTTVAQTEVTVGTKTFVVTTAESTSTSYINMGLVDVTE